MYRFLYNAELLRQQVKQGEDYTSAHVVRSLIISYGHILDNAPLYKCYFRMVDDEHHIVYPFNRMEITIIQLEYINQVINEMTSFNQLMYLFKNEKPYDKIEIDYRIKEAIQMHDKYKSFEYFLKFSLFLFIKSPPLFILTFYECFSFFLSKN